MKLLNTYLKYDGKITEEQFNQCIEIAKSLGYIEKLHLCSNIYNNFVDVKFFHFSNYHSSSKHIYCVDNNEQKSKK